MYSTLQFAKLSSNGSIKIINPYCDQSTIRPPKVHIYICQYYQEHCIISIGVNDIHAAHMVGVNGINISFYIFCPW